MGMSIQEILAAQQRAVNAKRQASPPQHRAPAPKPAGNTVQDILAAQQRLVAARAKVVPPPAPKPATVNSVAQIIEQQRVAVAAKAAATAGVNPALSTDQKTVIESIRARYNVFLDKLDKELAGQQLFMTPPAEPIFTPNVPSDTEVTVESQPAPAEANGISVGEEMGGQVKISARPKRPRKTKSVKVEPAAETKEPASEV